jgi:hypothetical protein
MRSREKVVEALTLVAAAEERAATIARREFPEGSTIRWERGGATQLGTIETFSYHHGPRFRVRNERTGKTYWISFYDVVRAAGTRVADTYISNAVFSL